MSTIELPLSQGHIAVIDEIDHDLSQFKWRATVRRNNVYAVRSSGGRRNKVSHSLHRIILGRILGRPLAKQEIVDHIDGNGLNNTRVNLRLATQAQNCRNSRISSRNTSGYKGVSWSAAAKKWAVQITTNYKTVYVGVFASIDDAVHAYQEAALRYHGDFARFSTAMEVAHE